jgi:hypothetical protein
MLEVRWSEHGKQGWDLRRQTRNIDMRGRGSVMGALGFALAWTAEAAVPT